MNIEEENWLEDVEETPTETEENQEGAEVEETKEEVKEETTEEQKLIDLLKSKVVYNGNSVEINSIDDIVTNYQKGLNYDNLKSKQDREENAVLDYINSKAKSMGISAEKYIEKVKEYEEEQRRKEEEQQIEEMIENGVPEQVAKEVIETRAFREELKKEKAELEEQKKEIEKEKEKKKEYEDFLKNYPDIDIDKIPKEVFEDAQNMSIQEAYIKYENKQLKEKIQMMEQNQKNKETSPIKSVTDTGKLEQESEDDFLAGFNSI